MIIDCKIVKFLVWCMMSFSSDKIKLEIKLLTVTNSNEFLNYKWIDYEWLYEGIEICVGTLKKVKICWIKRYVEVECSANS